jgi:hypothetical protein
MEDLDTSQIRNPLLGIARGVTTWVDAHPDEVAGAIQEHLLERAKKRNKIKACDCELAPLPDEPELARDCRVALEIAHTESAAKILLAESVRDGRVALEKGLTEPAAKIQLAKRWGINDEKQFDSRYQEAFRAHMEHDKLRRERNADLRAGTKKIDPPSNVTIGERVIQLVGRVDALVAENEAKAAWRGLHSLSDCLGLDDDTFAGIVLAAYGEIAEVDELAISWEKVRDHFGLDAEGRKNGASARTKDKANRRSWTQTVLDDAIYEYKAKRAKSYDGLVAAVKAGKAGAKKKAQKLYGRNAIARALGVKSRSMVSKSRAWVAIAKELGFELQRHRASGTRRTVKPGRIGLNMADEEQSQSPIGGADNVPADVQMETTERQETIRQINRLVTSAKNQNDKERRMQDADAIFKKLQQDEITDEDARAIVDLTLNLGE